MTHKSKSQMMYTNNITIKFFFIVSTNYTTKSLFVIYLDPHDIWSYGKFERIRISTSFPASPSFVVEIMPQKSCC